MKKGYFGIGIFNPRYDINVSSLFRGAHAFGADFLYTIGSKYEKTKADTGDVTKHIPYFHYENEEEFVKGLPAGAELVSVELSEAASKLSNFYHPKRAVYLLGNEREGVPFNLMNKSKFIVQIPTNICLNVGVTGSIVMYDRTLRSLI